MDVFCVAFFVSIWNSSLKLFFAQTETTIQPSQRWYLITELFCHMTLHKTPTLVSFEMSSSNLTVISDDRQMY